ncbi:MAG: fumarylacetoacetate hydrolase family protein [Rhodocyclaceae bacterium]
MLEARELDHIASQVWSAHKAVRQIAPFSQRVAAFDLPSAYAVAQRVHARHMAEGAVPVGRKLGFTNADMWRIYGVRDPIWAYVYDQTVVSFDTGEGTCRIGRFAEPKIEPEIVFHFRTQPPVGSDLRALLASIDWVAHAFEVVQSHFPGWAFQAADTVADSALHGTLLIGPPVAIDQFGEDPLTALAHFSLTLACDGAVCEVGTGANVLGSPLRALAHLTEVLASQPDALPLQPGELVTTGTLTRAYPLTPGQTWTTEVHGIPLPGLSVHLEP